MFDRVVDHSSISKNQILKAVDIMLDEARRLEDGDYTMISIGSMFIDCADRALVIPLAVSPQDQTAHVATFARKDAMLALHKECQATHLRVVDPYNDPHVWAVVDDGCNSCCHSTVWHTDARETWRKLGFQSYLISDKPTMFNGVGTRPTTGKYRLPLGFRLQESDLTLPGTFQSHEFSGGTHPLLLSQSLQALLGMTKNVRNGTIQIMDYENQNLEVVRQARTGLFMVRVDHLLVNDFLK